MSSGHVTKLLALAVPLLCAAPLAAQTQRTKLFKRAHAPIREVQLDLATGVYTRGPSVRNRGGGTIADFQNLDALDGSGFGWLSVDTGAGSCRWFSNAAKGAAANQSQNASDLMTDVVFFYCTAAQDVGSGGAGGAVTLGFYEGYTVFGGAPTTAATVVALTGMPAASSYSSFFSPYIACFALRVTFPTMIAFADNAFMGYSWQFDDVGTDGTLGATFPFISCVVSCSGINIATKGTAGGQGFAGDLGLGEDGQGMLDLIDQFCTTPAVSSTFTFGTVLPPYAPNTRTSVDMQVQEAADLVTTNVNYNATLTPNADTLSASRATLGSTWTATLTRAVPTPPGSMLVTVRRGRTPFPNGTFPTPPITGQVLIAGALLGNFAGVHNGTTGSIATAVPLSLAFCGVHFAAQCRSVGAGLKLSSAVEGTVGTF